ncbi:hypothetical protein ACFQ3P_19130 [Paraburkholderia sabiae]|uniref:ATP-dependent RNA helicase SrmB n=1 Tax=Paraburkholderia sabiae TaxID=273251 RepID=A0ABU9QBA0_9BURK|nr:hypothetical protein [Paraburkholderia sabiae]WJZ72439.1 hypothetical protein QEN71_19990 [Paraburkholderia sabiae]
MPPRTGATLIDRYEFADATAAKSKKQKAKSKKQKAKSKKQKAENPEWRLASQTKNP